MRLEFRQRKPPSREGARYARVEVCVDGLPLGYIEGLEETYVIHMPGGGEVGPYPSLAEAKRAVQTGLRAGVLRPRRH